MVCDRINAKNRVEFYSAVNETGEEKGHKHTHVLIGFFTAPDVKNPRYFDIDDAHPNIERVTTDAHWKHCVVYHRKENQPYTNISNVAGMLGTEKQYDTNAKMTLLFKQKTLPEALMNVCESVGEVGGLITAFNMKPVDYGVEPEVKWEPWQNSLIEELKRKPDDRKIIWYYDPIGGCGKTFFAKHMGMYRDAFVTTKANIYHVATQLQDYMKKGKTMLTVIFNFARESERIKIYQAMEALKDGLVTAEKYHGETLFFPSPHVIIFANYFPNLQQVSLDRWNVRTVDKSTREILHNLNGKEIMKWVMDNVSEYGNLFHSMEAYIEKINKECGVDRQLEMTESLL